MNNWRFNLKRRNRLGYKFYNVEGTGSVSELIDIIDDDIIAGNVIMLDIKIFKNNSSGKYGKNISKLSDLENYKEYNCRIKEFSYGWFTLDCVLELL